MASQTGVIFKVTTFGESHGPALGCIIDGCPAGVMVDLKEVQCALNRRRPGQSSISSPRAEPDTVELLSGIEHGIALGTPITLMVKNKDALPSDYSETQNVFRPGHADFTYHAKFGLRASSGGGRASARETLARVAAGNVAKQMLNQIFSQPISVVAWVHRIGHIECSSSIVPTTLSQVDQNELRAPDHAAAQQMKEYLQSLITQGDTAGGLIKCKIKGVPPGWGEPVFDKLEAELAKAMLSLPASKSFEIGAGLASTYMSGSQHNDPFTFDSESQRIITCSNYSGGIQGGISNGMDIEFSIGFKPVSTIKKEQDTVDSFGNQTTLTITKGRHDPCVLPRAVPMVEAMAWLVLADHALRAQLNRKDRIQSFEQNSQNTQYEPKP